MKYIHILIHGGFCGPAGIGGPDGPAATKGDEEPVHVLTRTTPKPSRDRQGAVFFRGAAVNFSHLLGQAGR